MGDGGGGTQAITALTPNYERQWNNTWDSRIVGHSQVINDMSPFIDTFIRGDTDIWCLNFLY